MRSALLALHIQSAKLVSQGKKVLALLLLKSFHNIDKAHVRDHLISLILKNNGHILHYNGYITKEQWVIPHLGKALFKKPSPFVSLCTQIFMPILERVNSPQP